MSNTMTDVVEYSAGDIFHPAIDAMKEVLLQIEEKVVTNYTLADAIREGSTVTSQKINGWGAGTEACALSAAMIAATARGYVSS